MSINKKDIGLTILYAALAVWFVKQVMNEMLVSSMGTYVNGQFVIDMNVLSPEEFSKLQYGVASFSGLNHAVILFFALWTATLIARFITRVKQQGVSRNLLRTLYKPALLTFSGISLFFFMSANVNATAISGY
jgi:hypothetical protein